MQWRERLDRYLQEAMFKGGEVRVQFSLRNRNGKTYSIPIIRKYINNQVICDEIEIDEED